MKDNSTINRKGEPKVRNTKTLTLATLSVIRAGGKGHRKSQDAPDALEGTRMKGGRT